MMVKDDAPKWLAEWIPDDRSAHPRYHRGLSTTLAAPSPTDNNELNNADHEDHSCLE
jgi:hypothetical protein